MFDEAAWDARAQEAAKVYPLKGLKRLPNIEGITPDAAKNLKWKAAKYMMGHDEEGKIRRHLLRHPLRYLFGYLRSVFKKKPYRGKDGDFFLYGVESIEEFRRELKDSLLVIGFSYCHKPHECPSKRFTSDCIHDQNNPVCQQCFIGKALHAAPTEAIPVIIPTIHYIGDKMFEVAHKYPKRKLRYIITACELTLEMFGDFGNMVGAKGLGVRLDGRICNTMKAFELSEEGIKPGLTVVLPQTQAKILDLLRNDTSDPDCHPMAST